MKSFYASAVKPAVAFPGQVANRSVAVGRPAGTVHPGADRRGNASGWTAVTASPATTERQHVLAPSPARIAVYDSAGAPPRVEEIDSEPIGEYITHVASRTYELARGMGGSIPFAVVNEVVENFIHADFREPVVTILDAGNTIRFSDQGPGIADKQRAVEPGYTTATQAMKRYVRGVGSGLPLARECLSFSGGSLLIEDNLGCGAVVTVSSLAKHGPAAAPASSPTGSPLAQRASAGPAPTPATTRLSLPGLGSLGSQDAGTSPKRAGGSAMSLDSVIVGAPAASSVAPSPPTRALLTHRQKRVLALVMEAATAGPSLVARELTIGLSTAYRDLARLEELGLIVADEAGKRVITEEGARVLASLLQT